MAKAEGRCFEESAKLLMEAHGKNDDDTVTRLVHASVINNQDGKPMGHAWVEFDMDPDQNDGEPMTLVIDAADAARRGEVRPLPKEIFYKIGGVDPNGDYASYSYHQMLAKLAEHEHWGPWDLEVSR